MYKLSPAVLILLVIAGLMAGLTGVALNEILHCIQKTVFAPEITGHIPFRVMVEESSPTRRVTALFLCGLLAGCGWYAVHRYGAKLMTVSAAVADGNAQMPVKTTLLHGLLQIITVGAGSPLGREVAPREISTALGTATARHFGLAPDSIRLVAACASGAGLAAVYNVPAAAVLFTLETLLFTCRPKAVAAAVLCSGTAVVVVHIFLGDIVQYVPPAFALTTPVLLWAAVAGPMIAFAVWLFSLSLKKIPALPRNKLIMIPAAAAAFLLIGFMSVFFPEILGNGKAGNELSFSLALTPLYALGLFAAKWIAVWLATAGGAYGGRITPSMMLGGMLALLLAVVWNFFLPAIPAAEAAFVGAAVFLGIGQKMPITAAVFLIELSHAPAAALLPVALCMASAWLAVAAVKRLQPLSATGK